MTWWGWTILAGYVLGWIVTWRAAVWHEMSDGIFGWDDLGDVIAVSLAFGFLMAVLWLPVVLFFAADRNYEGGLRVLFEPRRERHARQLRERDERIAQLESQLGVRR